MITIPVLGGVKQLIDTDDNHASRLRWDKGDTLSYYYDTYARLRSQIKIPEEL
jgi:hypothetical protein